MNLKELIRTRRTVHQFKAESLPWSDMEEALELSLWAPNHRLTFPWKFIKVSDEQRAQMVDLAISLKTSKDPSYSEIKKQALKNRLMAPAYWISLGINRNPDSHIFEEDQATMSCSVQIASLALWEKGIGSKWSTGGFSMHDKTYEILKVSKESHYLMGVLFVGKVDVMPPTPNRPELSRFLS